MWYADKLFTYFKCIISDLNALPAEYAKILIPIWGVRNSSGLSPKYLYRHWMYEHFLFCLYAR